MNVLAVILLGLTSVADGGSTKPTIVLVHGAFADGSSWSRVIPILERDGYNVIAVQSPLTSLPDDVALESSRTRPGGPRLIDRQRHSKA